MGTLHIYKYIVIVCELSIGIIGTEKHEIPSKKILNR